MDKTAHGPWKARGAYALQPSHRPHTALPTGFVCTAGHPQAPQVLLLQQNFLFLTTVTRKRIVDLEGEN
jgi:hypothetical protein